MCTDARSAPPSSVTNRSGFFRKVLVRLILFLPPGRNCYDAFWADDAFWCCWRRFDLRKKEFAHGYP